MKNECDEKKSSKDIDNRILTDYNANHLYTLLEKMDWTPKQADAVTPSVKSNLPKTYPEKTEAELHQTPFMNLTVKDMSRLLHFSSKIDAPQVEKKEEPKDVHPITP